MLKCVVAAGVYIFWSRYYAIGLGNNEDFVTVTDLCEPIFCLLESCLKISLRPPK